MSTYGGRCVHCKAELPEDGRFCVSCGRRVGHPLRDKSSDRRVYTSPLGHSVPPELPELIFELDRDCEPPSSKTAELAPASLEAGATRDRAHGKARHRGRLAEAVQKPRRSLLEDVLYSVLWGVLLSTLGAAVAWGVYTGLRHAAPLAPPPLPLPLPPEKLGATGTPRPAPAPPVRPRSPIQPPPAPVPASVAAPALPPKLSSEVRASSVQREGAADVHFVASTHSPQVRACYDRAFRHAGAQAPAGRVELSFTIVDSGDAGRAVDIVTELNLLGDDSVAACLKELLEEWYFPRPPPRSADSPPQRVRYPFVFTPGE